jgi:hypothetical protein
MTFKMSETLSYQLEQVFPDHLFKLLNEGLLKALSLTLEIGCKPPFLKNNSLIAMQYKLLVRQKGMLA